MQNCFYRIVLVGGSVLAIVNQSLNAQVDFDTTSRIFRLGDGPIDCASADFDKDGLLDLAVANNRGNSVSVLLGEGDGALGPAASFTAQVRPTQVLVTDVDGDANADLVVVNSGSNTLSVLRGAGNGSFSAAMAFPVGSQPFAAVALDINRDGRIDLVAANSFSDNVTVLLGDGVGGFLSNGNFTCGDNPRGLVAADFDGDGLIDLATADFNANTISLLRGDGQGYFAAPTTSNAGVGPENLQAADLDEDGALDLLAVNKNADRVSVILNDGSGGFAAPIALPTGASPNRVTIADLDRDGHLDLLTANSGDKTLSLVLGDGAGGALETRTIRAGDDPRVAIAGRWNGDAELDVVVLNFATDSAYVLEARASVTFAPQNVLVEAPPLDFAAAEFDGDEYQDLALAVLGQGYVAILLNDQQGSLMAPLFVPTGSLNTEACIAADFNEDGLSDLAVACPGSSAIVVLLNLGGAVFGPPVVLAHGTGPHDLVTADFNSDGHVDLAAPVSASDPGSVRLYFGDGSGQFTAITVYTRNGFRPHSVVSGDFDNNGSPDLVIADDYLASIGRERVISLVNNGVGQFTEVENDFAKCMLRSIVVGDINEDANLDVVCTDGNRVVFGLGSGNGAFGGFQGTGQGDGATSVSLVDLNEDSHLDLAIANTPVWNVSIHVGTGSGLFGGPQTVRAGIGLASIVALDFDRDNHIDLAASNTTSEDVTLFDNRTFDFLDCRRGNVNAAAGSIRNVLFLNGLIGLGRERRIRLSSTDPFVLTMATPPSRLGGAPFAVYAFAGEPTGATVTEQPFGLGMFCMSTPLTGGRPVFIANNIGYENQLGRENWPRPTRPAPSTLLNLPAGTGRLGTFFLQGFIVDRDAPNGKAAVTNGIVVVSE